MQGETGRLILVGDVGGTHLRLALATLSGTSTSEKADLSSVEEGPHGARVDLPGAVAAYWARVGGGRQLDGAVLAVAGPVIGGAASLTNASGGVSEAALSTAVGGAPARLLNDFGALALAAGVLRPGDLRRIGPDIPGEARGTLAVLGPGTGLGVSALVRDGRGEAVAVTEGGHIGFAPTDEVEVAVWRAVTAGHGRCSLERLLCGPGLLTLHRALGGTGFDDPAALVEAAAAGSAAADTTVERFCAMLGAAAGDVALMFGARGGVLIGGGIAPRLLPWLDRGDFRARFEAKGRFAGYLAAIPTSVIVHPQAALIGAARALA